MQGDTDLPGYLLDPPAGSETWGTLRIKGKHFVVDDASPAVMECIKRVVPSAAGRHSKKAKFPLTARSVGDLSWLMLRYPLKIECKEEYEKHKQLAVAHHARRKMNMQVTEIDQPAEFKGQLYDFQKQGVSFLVNNRRALLADSMGLGKTITGIASMLSINAWPALVVAPPNIRGYWINQLKEFAGIDGVILKGRSPTEMPESKVYVTSYNLLESWKDWIINKGLGLVLYDEIQDLRHTGTMKYSAASAISEGIEFVCGLSGTPIHNYGDEIWAVMNILEYHCLGDRDSFTREWCTGYGNKVVRKPEVLGSYLRSEGLILRRRKEDVDHHLPPKHSVCHEIGHDETAYGKLIEDALKLSAGYEKIRSWADRGKAARRISEETRRATGVAKAPYVGAFVETLLQAGERPLVYAWHHDVHDAIKECLKDWKLGTITGKDTIKNKEKDIQSFIDRKLDAMVMSLRATAGIDGLQKSGTCIVFAELDWSPAVMEQCICRIHRFGIDPAVMEVPVYYLVSKTGYDSVVMDALGIKKGQFQGIVGDPDIDPDQEVVSQRAAEDRLKKIIAAITLEDPSK